MTRPEMIAWGQSEHETRLDDLVRVHAGTLSIQDAQKYARKRASRSGISAADADQAVRLARIARSNAPQSS